MCYLSLSNLNTGNLLAAAPPGGEGQSYQLKGLLGVVTHFSETIQELQKYHKTDASYLVIQTNIYSVYIL